jgi:muramoyltetrapeptide carboxypeptidase
MLTQLALSGVLACVAGVVVGELVGCDAPQGPERIAVAARAVLEARLGELAVPVALGAPVGHGAHNVALPLGVEAALVVEAGRAELSFAGSGS